VTELLLHPVLFPLCLLALAIGTMVIGPRMARKHRNDRRLWLVVTAAGPVILTYWFFHQLVLEVVGFDSIISVIIVIGLAALLGWFAGRWAAPATNAPSKPEPPKDPS
jgi:hypothetical protein